MRKFLIISTLLLLIGVGSYAQTRNIKGTVKGEGEPLAGASLVANGGNYALTDIDGTFTRRGEPTASRS